jgi:hypothetical protein
MKLMALFVLLTLTGCGAVTKEQVDLAREIMAQSGSNCVFIQGSGGAGAGALPPGIPMGGGYGQGSLAAAHSEGDHDLTCGATGSSVTSKP